MEFYNKETGLWEKISDKKITNEVIKIYDYMQAEMDILATIEGMKLEIRLREKND